MFAMPEIISDTNWNPDSRASNHISLDIGNLMTKADYFGPNHVHTGNGMGVTIKHWLIKFSLFLFSNS